MLILGAGVVCLRVHIGRCWLDKGFHSQTIFFLQTIIDKLVFQNFPTVLNLTVIRFHTHIGHLLPLDAHTLDLALISLMNNLSKSHSVARLFDVTEPTGKLNFILLSLFIFCENVISVIIGREKLPEVVALLHRLLLQLLLVVDLLNMVPLFVLFVTTINVKN